QGRGGAVLPWEGEPGLDPLAQIDVDLDGSSQRQNLFNGHTNVLRHDRTPGVPASASARRGQASGTGLDGRAVKPSASMRKPRRRFEPRTYTTTRRCLSG